jgi:hypothetical protein
MQYGICLLSVVSCRKESSNTSEIVTQLLFGEHYSVIETTENWLKINIAFDSYECWINSKQHQKISDTTFKQLNSEVLLYSNELIQVIINKQTQISFPISLGSALPFLKNNNLKIEDYEFYFDGNSTLSNSKKSNSEIIQTSYLFLNAPYLWGGKSPFGIDCSGFTQIVYKLNGYKLPRDAHQQVELGEPLNFVDEAEAGDLAFFDNEDGKIVHVGLLLNNQQIIHANGQVRIDNFDHYGIFNSTTKKYSHTLRVIKRLI